LCTSLNGIKLVGKAFIGYFTRMYVDAAAVKKVVNWRCISGERGGSSKLQVIEQGNEVRCAKF